MLYLSRIDNVIQPTYEEYFSRGCARGILAGKTCGSVDVWRCGRGLPHFHTSTPLLDHPYRSADARPAKQPPRVLGAQVDAAVAHGRAEVVVPVGAVQAIALIEVHHIRHAGQVVA